jgi:hypothetical protein
MILFDCIIQSTTGSGHGIIIDINNIIYIVTCYHIIDNNQELPGNNSVDINDNIICTLQSEKTINKFKCNIVGYFKEIDIILLQPELTSYDYNLLKINNVCVDFKDYNMYYDLEFCIKHVNDINIFCHIYNDCNENNITNFKIKELNILQTNLKSILIPSLPLFTTELDLLEKNVNINELGGLGILLDEKIIGMIFAFYDEKIQIIPIYFIKVFVDKILQYANNNNITKNFKLKGFIINTIFATIIDEKSGEKFNTRFINNDCNIGYKNILSNDNIKFKKEDIIIEINNLKFNDNGKIFIDELNYEISLDSYILLLNTNNINFKYIKRDKKLKLKNNNIPKYITLNPKNYESYYNINISSYDTDNFYYNGITFCEISEEILKFLENKNNNFNFTEIREYYSVKQIDNDKKYVIILDFDRTLNTDIQNDLIKYGLPYFYKQCDSEENKIIFDDIKHLIKIEKIGRKNINNINDLKNLLINKKNTRSIKYNVNNILKEMKM